MTPHQLKTFAHHQAGHAVACCYLKVAFKRVTIDSDEPHFITNKKRGAYSESQIIATYAGEYAQRKSGRRGRMTANSVEDHVACRVMRDDFSDQDSLCDMLQGRLLRRRAELFVDLRWEDIQVVALGILERKRLTHAEVVKVLNKVEGNTSRSVTPRESQ